MERARFCLLNSDSFLFMPIKRFPTTLKHYKKSNFKQSLTNTRHQKLVDNSIGIMLKNRKATPSADLNKPKLAVSLNEEYMALDTFLWEWRLHKEVQLSHREQHFVTKL